MSDSEYKELQRELQKDFQESQKQLQKDWKEVKDRFEDLKQEQAASLSKIESRYDDLGKRLAGAVQNLELIKSELASVKNQLSAVWDEKIFEHKPYSDKLKELIKRAYFNTHSSPRDNRIVELGLTQSQQPLAPFQYDILAGTYLLAPTRLGANSSTLDGHVEGKNHSGIRHHAVLLNHLGYLTVQLTIARKHVSGTRPGNYDLTQKGREVLLDQSRSPPTEDRHAHADMERKRLIEAVTHPPFPQVYMCTRKDIGSLLPEVDRCDAIVRGRKDGESYGEGIRAVNIETDRDFETYPYRPKKEGTVFVNIVTPFVFGANSLEVVCQQASIPELRKMWNALPSWMQGQIHFNPIP